MEMKNCSWCKETLPLDRFSKRTYSSGNIGYQSKCKSCEKVSKKRYYKPHENIRRALNISDSDYTTLIEKSQGHCEVCSRPLTKICIDHDHNTGKVRGVLCNNCNTALGLVGDNVSTLTKLIQYLER